MRYGKLILVVLSLCCLDGFAGTPDDRLLDALIVQGGRIELQPREYVLTEPLNLRRRPGVVIEGSGGRTVLHWTALPRAGDAAVDLCGGRESELRDLALQVDQSCSAGFAVLSARERPDGDSCGEHRFVNVTVRGHTLGALAGEYGAEENVWNDCKLFQTGPAWVYHTAYAAPIASTSLGVLGGGSNVQHTLLDCHFGTSHSAAPGLVSVGDGTVWLRIEGGGGSMKTATSHPFACAVWLQGRAGAPVQMIDIRNWQTETPAALNWLRATGDVRGVSLSGSLLWSQSSPIRLVAGASIQDSQLIRNYWLSVDRAALVDIGGSMVRTSLSIEPSLAPAAAASLVVVRRGGAADAASLSRVPADRITTE